MSLASLMGLGPCLAFCAPILIPYITGSEKSWLGGLKDVLVFSLSRLVITGLLGSLAGGMGYLLSSPKFDLIKYLGLGIFVFLLGVVMLLGGRDSLSAASCIGRRLKEAQRA